MWKVRLRRGVWRAAKWLGVVVGVVVLLLMLAVGWLLTGWGRGWVKEQALERVRGAVAGEVRWEGLDYGLGGGVRASGLSVAGADGQERVIALEEVSVDLGVGSLVWGGDVEVESLRVQGLRVWARQGADGRWNLQGLLKPRQPSAAAPASPPRGLRLSGVEVRDLSAWFELANGARGGLEGLSLAGEVARSAAGALTLRLFGVGAQRLWWERPDAGLGVWLDDITGEGVAVSAEGVTSGGEVGAWRGKGTLKFPGVAVEKSFDWVLGGAAWSRDGQRLSAHVEGVTAGWVSLGRLEVEGEVAEGKLSGPLRVLLQGLHLNADALNRLFDKPLLATDVDANLTIGGPLAEVAVAGDLTTQGGVLTGRGVIDLRDLSAPRYTLSLVGERIDTAKLLHPSVRRLPLLESSLRVDVKGEGVTRDTVEADIDATVGPTRLEGVPIEGVWLKAKLRRGRVSVESLRVGALGQSLTLDGSFDPETREVKTHLLLDGDAREVAKRCAEQALPCPEILQKSEGTLTLDITGALRLPPAAPEQPGLPAAQGASAHLRADAQVRLIGEGLVTPQTTLKRLDLDMHAAVDEWDATKPFTRPKGGLLPAWVLARLPFQRGRLVGYATVEGFSAPGSKLAIAHAHAIVDLDLTGEQPLGTVEVVGRDLTFGDALRVEAFGLIAVLTRDQLGLSLTADDPTTGVHLNARAHAQPSVHGVGWDLHVTAFSFHAPNIGEASLDEPITLWLPEDLLFQPQRLLLPLLPISALGGHLLLKGSIDTEPTTDAQGRPSVKVSGVDLTVALESLPLGALAAVGGAKLPKGLSGRLSGDVSVRGPLTAPSVSADLRARLSHPKLSTPLAVGVSLRTDLAAPSPEATLDVSASQGGAKLLSLSAAAPLTKTTAGRVTLDGARPLRLSLSAPDVPLSLFAPWLPAALRPALDGARLSLSAQARGDAASPRASAKVSVGGEGLPLVVDLSAALDGARLTADLRARWRADDAEAATAHVTLDGLRLPAAGRPARPPKRWSVTASVARASRARLAGLTDLLPALKEPLERLADGAVSASLSASADGDDLRAQADVSVYDLVFAPKAGAESPLRPPLSATLGVTLDDPGVTLTLDADASPLRVTARGLLDLPARDLKRLIARRPLSRDALRAAPLSLKVEAPALALEQWAQALPGLRAVGAWPGRLGVLGTLSGSMKEPRLDVAARYDGFDLSAAPGGAPEAGLAVARLTLDDDMLRAAFTLGGVDAPERLRVEASTPAPPLRAFKMGQALALKARVDAAPQPLMGLLPAHLAPTSLDLSAEIDADLRAEVNLQTGILGSRLEGLALGGGLHIARGAFTLPGGGGRALHDVTLDLRADQETIAIDRLSARERAASPDLPDRTLALSGQVSLTKNRPAAATLHIQTDRWLAVGKPYAPTAEVTLDADLTADLTDSPRSVHLQVNALDLQNPNRFKFAHYQDFLDRGDVAFLAPGEAPGKLVAKPTPPAVSSLLRSDTPWQVDLTLPASAHAYFSPLDLHVTGGLRALIGPDGLRVIGAINAHAGEMEFTGTRYTLDRGQILFDGDDAGCGRGCLDLHFTKPPDNAALRDLSLVSGGGLMGVSLVGPIGQQDLLLHGAGNADLVEVSAIQNARRPRYVSQPDMPASQAVQHPGPETPLIHTFLRTNMPHLVLVDRASAWADPLDDLDAYGKLQHAEVDDYSTDGARRVHIQARPPTPGLPRAELGYDWLLRNDARWLIGAGPRLGDAAQAGVRLFLRWSSDR
jgi:hypothetical protein